MSVLSPVRVRHDAIDGRHFASSDVCGERCVHETMDEGTIRQRLAHLDFALHRLARDHISSASRSSAWTVIRHESCALWESLVPSCARRAESDDRPLVISPSQATGDVPWAVAAAGRVVFVKATTFDGDRAIPAAGHSTLTIAGPDLAAAEHEAALVAGQHRAGGSDVWIARSKHDVLHGLERSSLAHFACHGLRGGALQLFDGTLDAADISQCRHLPSVVVLSACNAAVSGTSEMSGVAAGLVAAGVSTVIAPVAPINDQQSVPFMSRLHSRLAGGDQPAAALAAATSDAHGVIDPAAAAFVCLTA